MAQETVICTCVPYEWNWSQDVEKCALDLVLSCCTRTDTVRTTALASKGVDFPRAEPLTNNCKGRHITGDMKKWYHAIPYQKYVLEQHRLGSLLPEPICN